MNKDGSLVILLLIIALGLYGSIKGPATVRNTPEQKQADIARQLQDTQSKVDDLKEQVQIEVDNKTKSQYRDVVKISTIATGADPENEYIVLQVSSRAKSPINITGWTLKSTSTNISINIPKASKLYFAGMVNSEEDVYVSPGDTVYLVTSISPNGASFKINKCSGYLTQFQTFYPYISSNCPLPRDEDLSSIPNSPNNDACLTYISNFPSCSIQTRTLPENWSYECTNFIYKKINYPSCIDTHKNDPDFYQPEWRIYLKRSERLWKDRRENIVLYDNEGKIVSTYRY